MIDRGQINEIDKPTLTPLHPSPGLAPPKSQRSTGSRITYRVRGVSHIEQLLKRYLGSNLELQIHSLVTEPHLREDVATVIFKMIPDQLQDNLDEWTFGEGEESMTIDTHFRGLTTLSSPQTTDHKTE